MISFLKLKTTPKSLLKHFKINNMPVDKFYVIQMEKIGIKK